MADPVVNELVELATALRWEGADASLVGRLDSTLERLQDEQDTRNARLARFVAESAWFKIVRMWSAVSRTEQNRRILVGPNPQGETDQLAIKRLAQEYESALLATVAVPGVDASVITAIDTQTFTRNPEQAVLAAAALGLLGEHITALERGEQLDVRRALDEAYPLAR